MGVDRRLTLTYAVTNILFMACGAVTIAISLLWNMQAINSPSFFHCLTMLTLATGDIEQNIVFLMTPNMFGLVAGIITVIAGISSLPRMSHLYLLMTALVLPSSRDMLYVHSWLAIIASTVLLVLGLIIWALTLEEKANIFAAYSQQSVQHSDAIFALQEKVSLLRIGLTCSSTVVGSSIVRLRHS
jgi:hypothetical protein